MTSSKMIAGYCRSLRRSYFGVRPTSASPAVNERQGLGPLRWSADDSVWSGTGVAASQQRVTADFVWKGAGLECFRLWWRERYC